MNGGAVQIVYDGDGNRVAKTVNGVTTKYLVDDLNPTGYAQVMDELASGAVTRTYTYGLQRIAQDQVISNTWTPSFYGYDGGGNVRTLTNTAGAITDSYEYDGFGNQLTTNQPTPNNYLYRGEQFDSDLGLYYLRARYYNPTTGRFMSQDPYDGEVHDPASLHRYRYAAGNPVNMLDPSGQDSITEYAKNVLSIVGRAAPVVEFANEVVCVYSAEAQGIDLVNHWGSDTRVQRAMRITSLGLTVAVCGASIKGIGGPPEVEPIEPEVPEPEAELEPEGCSNPLPDGVAPYQLGLWPEEPYNRVMHYGYTPTPAQRASVPPGMEFDHDPSLVEHYYEGPGDGSLAGFNLTQAEREAYAASLEHGRPATPEFQRAQGRLAAYSKRMKRNCGF